MVEGEVGGDAGTRGSGVGREGVEVEGWGDRGWPCEQKEGRNLRVGGGIRIKRQHGRLADCLVGGGGVRRQTDPCRGEGRQKPQRSLGVRVD